MVWLQKCQIGTNGHIMTPISKQLRERLPTKSKHKQTRAAMPWALQAMVQNPENFH